MEVTPLMMARSTLRAYVAMQFPRYVFGEHHHVICDALERVERGECKRLMIFMPPRHGKSMLVSEYFPAWFLGRQPSKKIIAASYNAELAQDFGRKVRNQLRDGLWQAVFPGSHLDNNSAAADRINLTAGGSYFAVGVGGAVTGRGADVMIIDDPIKGREEADSETYRRKIKDWYASTAYTRLMPGGAVIMVLTRWHEDDLAGWALAEHQHENWEVISMPAVAEHGDRLGRPVGEALWPEFYPIERLDDIKRTIGMREWNALYQQRPTPDEGAYFLRAWFQTYDELPNNRKFRFYGASDYAVTDGDGDFTVHLCAANDEDDNIWLIDMWRGQTASLEWIEAFVSMLKMWRPEIWAEEAGVIMKSLGPIIEKRLQEEHLYCTTRRQFASATDKPTRARSLQARMQMGKVLFPNPATHPWVSDLMAEMLTFPAGKHDDMVDALSLLCRLLTDMTSPKPMKANVKTSRPARAVWR